MTIGASEAVDGLPVTADRQYRRTPRECRAGTSADATTSSAVRLSLQTISHEAKSLTGRVSPQELEFQETLIAEREAEIRDIETGIHELNDIFRDLGTIVEQQGGLIGSSS